MIWSDDTNDIIDEIKVVNTHPVDYRGLVLSIRDYPTLDRASLAGVSRIWMDDCSDTSINLKHLHIDGDILADGSDGIFVDRIESIDVGGDVVGHILASYGSVEGVTLGNLATIRIDGDLIDGGIYSDSNDIDLIDIGGSVKSTNVRTEIWSSGSINEIIIGGDLDGRVGQFGLASQGNCIYSSFTEHSDVGVVDIGGSFIGQRFMWMNTLDELFVGGNFDVKINVNSVMADTSVYDIAGTMDTDARIYLPSDGLEGQVVINSGNNGDSWDGNVYVSTTPLSSDYTNLSSELGGGAVGVAPFNFHQRDTAPPAGIARDCDPYHHEVVTVPALSDNAIPIVTLDHYGPVYIVNDGTEPTAGEHFIVEFKPDYQTGTPTWFDRSDQFIVNDAGTSSANAKRKIEITKSDSKGTGFQASGHWRITPVQGKVFCGGVAGSLPASYFSDVQASTVSTSLIPETDYWYTFRVIQQAPQSLLLDSGNGPSSTDLSIWLQDPYETNGDGDIDSNDFVDMAEHYGE